MNEPVQQLEQPTELDLAAQAWRESKLEEDAAKQKRILAEEQIIALMGAKDEGSLSEKTQFFKVTTAGKMTRTLDASQLPVVQSNVPQPIYERVISYTPKLNVKELKYVQENEPEIYAVFAQALTVKPAKTAVKVEML